VRLAVRAGERNAAPEDDMTHDKPMELDALHGAIVRRGRERDVAVPTNEAIYAILRPWAERNQRTRD
jgi:2-dehydropantoate 2-reductase